MNPILGIPDRSIKAALPNITKPQKWQFVIQEHNAKRAGLHYDIRLGDPSTGNGHSWAGRRLPGPGSKELFVEQPTHTIEYFKYEGTIGNGYGAGDVKIHTSCEAEVLHSEPNKITFYLYNEATPQKFTFLRMSGDQWLLVNHTLTKPQEHTLHMYPRQKYKEIKYADEIRQGDFVTPKIDGAYSLTILQPDKKPVVFGRRDSARTGMPIEYTPKIFNAMTAQFPKEFGNTVLRTEVYGITPDMKELPNRTLSGMLNAGVWKSRELQAELATPLRLAATDVIKFKGRDVSNLPTEEKYKIINEISQKFPVIENPLEVEKRILFPEGKVVWRDGTPYKLKNRPDFDVFARSIFPDKNGKRAGGFEYSLSPDGPIIGRVGTGWNNEEKKDMLNNMSSYVGRLATIYSQEQLPSGAYRAPSFKSWKIQ